VEQVETALIYDSVLLVAKALHELDRSQVVNIKSVSCEGVDSWSHGQSLVNYMKLVS
jgi:glutamate receptor, ionotropic, invertebrate